MQIGGTNGLVLLGRMVFHEVIGLVEDTFAPVNVKLALAHMIVDPVESHVDCFGLLLFHGIICNAKLLSV